jgi:tetratricopeptide (TPR) repeat protein
MPSAVRGGGARAAAVMPVAAVVLLAAGPLGCVHEPSPQAQQLLVDGYAAYQRGDDETVVKLTDAFLRDSARTTRADEAYRLRGLARYRLKEFAAAEADLAKAVERTKRSAFKAECLLMIGEIAREMGDVGKAERFYRDSLEHTDRGKKPSDVAHYRLGRILQRSGRWEEADKHLGHVAFLFGGSELAKRADSFAGAKAWTIQVGAFDRLANCAELARELRRKNLPARQHPALRGGKLLYMVHVGRYQTYQQAESALPAVQRHESDAFLTVTE